MFVEAEQKQKEEKDNYYQDYNCNLNITYTDNNYNDYNDYCCHGYNYSYEYNTDG